ncbi:hypothetical protein KY290_030559 [Solanum tuberosum]|uniref:Uncharacterized protein n=1 Tax=Solanum tuberosum TaxID=4113 RepID=A0ABQ7U6Z6_SOLTU|nr:hypothetical protein KY284_029581 [Solanum tuberosum]KAH0742566.1 hypothetical protein KY290_030559 [Solanum tuberosum]
MTMKTIKEAVMISGLTKFRAWRLPNPYLGVTTRFGLHGDVESLFASVKLKCPTDNSWQPWRHWISFCPRAVESSYGLFCPSLSFSAANDLSNGKTAKIVVCENHHTFAS